ncbi:MarR family transcriptional regulator [Rhodococcoides kyotonense]|uniref:MarR family transcriptional regulator n=1 Tax=Rhodococcoides kyotonense TaxID=398843 RepID=A0A177YLS8_9NOCA|nr:MarR family transcriptional regulator [Rhodococcus kyotonensis]
MEVTQPDSSTRDLLVELVTTSSRFARLAAQLGSDDHPRAWMRALSLLEEYQPLRISEFARLDRCSQPSATALLGKLADRGLVARTADPSDSRAVLVEMTDDGVAWLNDGRTHIGDGLIPYLSDFEPDQLKKLTAGLSELRTMLKTSISE